MRTHFRGLSLFDASFLDGCRRLNWDRISGLVFVVFVTIILWVLIFMHPLVMAAVYGGLFALALLLSCFRRAN